MALDPGRGRRRWSSGARLVLPFSALALLALDRITKLAIAESLPLYDSKTIIPGFFNLVHARNTGIAFSLLADAGPLVREWLLPAASLAAVAFMIVLLWRGGWTSRSTPIAITLILAGAAGNLYDRFAYGYVVDFLDFYIGGWHWPAFNVADSCITVGAALLLLSAAREPAAPPEPQRRATGA